MLKKDLHNCRSSSLELVFQSTMFPEPLEKVKRQLARMFGNATIVATTDEELEEKRMPVGVEKQVKYLLRENNASRFQLEAFGDRYILWAKTPVHGFIQYQAREMWQLNHRGHIIRTPLPLSFS
jgi:hypothetical protein